MYLPVILLIRRIFGAILVIIGILGLLLPVMPGWPLLIPGIALLGSKDPLIRYLHLLVLKVLKFVKTRKTPWIRNIGERGYDAYRRARAVIGPAILRFEQNLERWLNYTPKRPPEL